MNAMYSRTPRHQKGIQGIPPSNLVIGGLTIDAIKNAMKGSALRIGRIKPTNAFCIKVENEMTTSCPFLQDYYYVYVKTTYQGYRKAASRFLGTNGHIDHVLSRKLATQLEMRYVLTAIIQPDINILHGSIEKLGLAPAKMRADVSMLNLSKVVYMDNRIQSKLHLQKVHISKLPFYKGFDRDAGISHVGLDLRYGTNFNQSLGFDKQASATFVKSLKEFKHRVKV